MSLSAPGVQSPPFEVSLHGCPACGARDFAYQPVLWPDLVSAWGLSQEETDYINVQQGFHCVACGNNLRAMTLAEAMLRAYGPGQSLSALCRSRRMRRRRVLEVNAAGVLTSILQTLPHHRLVSFPDFDMQRMAGVADNTFDAVLHSDTLEHVPDALAALRECRRVLRPGGHLFYTVPVITGRLTRSRQRLPPSHHGDAGTEAADWLVQREYGADFWCEPLAAGFHHVTLCTLGCEGSLAVDAVKRD